MKVFISGGCKNGKSYHGQKIAMNLAREKGFPLYYVATMRPRDDEDLERIKRHREERKNWGFKTLEQEKKIDEILEEINPNSVVFLDSITALLENEMFDEEYRLDEDSPQRVIRDLDNLIEKVSNLVIISDYIYGDGIYYDKTTEFYKRGLSQVDKWLCSKCDRVLEVTFGNVMEYK